MNSGLVSGINGGHPQYEDLHVGNVIAGTSNYTVRGEGVEFIGQNNTIGGMNIVLGNRSNGTSAFADLFIQNDLADATGTHFAVFNLNSSTYNDTTFGTAMGIANQLQIYGTDGPTILGTTKSGSYLEFLVGGSATTNEVGRISSSGLTVGFAGTTLGKVLFSGSTSGTTTVQPAVAASGTLTLPAATDTLVGLATTDTLTNKRVTKRTGNTTSSATPTINTDTTDSYDLTAQAAAITSFTTNLSGTPVRGDTLRISITDNGTARAITWGTSFESSGTQTLPATTVISTRLDIAFVWNVATSKWRCVAAS